MPSRNPNLVAALFAWTCGSLVASAVHGQDSDAALRGAKASLALHAAFDRGVDADVARGDARLWNAPSAAKREAAGQGLPAGGAVTWERDQGRHGGCLRFAGTGGPIVFYKAARNFPELRPGWSATVMFWLKTDPAGELRDGFCDPIMITSKQWDDAALFVEFEKRGPEIPFRLGVFADRPVWNPTARKSKDVPAAERPLATVPQPPFEKGRWTHVAFTLSRCNSGAPDGVAELFLDGRPAARLPPRNLMFSWDAERSAIMLGLGYVGGMDDLAVFDRALTPQEIAAVVRLPNGIASLPATP